jgi:hypothetical protein
MSGEARITALTIFTGLVVSWVRNGLQHHWESFPSWGSFFTLWIVHTFGVALLCGIALAAIIYTHNGWQTLATKLSDQPIDLAA